MKLADRVFLILIIVVNARPAYDENKRLAASFSWPGKRVQVTIAGTT